MVAITLCTVCAPIAGAKYYEAPYTYVFEDGTTVEYNFDLDGNSLTTVNIQLSQKLKTLKRILIQAGRNGKNSYIKYNC